MTISRVCLATLLATPFASAQSGLWRVRDQASPGQQSPTAMAYDPSSGRTVLFDQSGGPLTWAWDGVQWRVLTSGGPRAAEYQMVYDDARRALLLVGSGSAFETWSWTGASWLDLQPAHEPGHRTGFGLAFDPVRGVTVLFGGFSSGSELADTWEFDGVDWVQRSSGGPTPRSSAAMTYDSDNGGILLFGGLSRSNVESDTWLWNGSYWLEFFGVPAPSARHAARLVPDPSGNSVLLLGGNDRGAGTINGFETWLWRNRAWTRLMIPGAPANWRVLAAVDSRRRIAVAHVSNSPPPPPQTWELFRGPPSPGSSVRFGAGCPTAGAPALASIGIVPRIGTAFGVRASGLPSSVVNPAFGIVGGFRDSWMGTPLPLSLAPFGAPECFLLVSPDVIVSLGTGATVTWNLTIPFDARIVGSRFFQQVLVLDRLANPLGIGMSNGLEHLIGSY